MGVNVGFRMRGTVAGIVSLSLAAASNAGAQGEDCLAGITMPEVGQWAQYQGMLNGDPHLIRYAVVGSEEREGKRMKWLELRLENQNKKDKTIVYQVLTPGSPAELDQAEAVVLKPGDKPAMKMNTMMLKMLRGQLNKHSILAMICDGVAPAGEESVTVPAGTFKSLKYHSTKYNSDTWVVPSRPFFLVKSVGKDFEMSLTSSGDGAKSSITETPQEMGGPGS